MAARRILVMRSVVNRIAMLSLVAMAVLGVAACNSTTAGQGTAEQPTGNTTQPGDGGGSTPSSSDTGGSGGASLASVQPCDLLSSSVQSQFGLSKADSIPVSGIRPCNWSKSVDANGLNGYSVEIDIRDHTGLKDIVTSGFTVSPDNVGSHQGRLIKLNAGGTCAVALGVGDSARVDVAVTAGTDTNQACDVANQLAKAVEPQLPSGS
jgi:hypothetical protein